MGPDTPNIQVTTHWTPLERAEFEKADRAVRRVVEQRVPDLVQKDEVLIKSVLFWFARPGQRIRTDPLAPEISFLHMSNVELHVDFVEGRAPSADFAFDAAGVPTFEFALPKQRADLINFKVGDVIEAMPGASRFGLVRGRVSGLFEALDWDEEYWLGLGESLMFPPPLRDDQELGATLIVHEKVALDAVGKVTAGLPATYWWWLYTNKQLIRDTTAGGIVSTVDEFEVHIEQAINQPNVISGLEPTFRALERKLLFARIPMLLIAALATAVVAYYLFLVSGLLARKREPDTVMLRSRGLSVLQVTRIHAMEAVALIGIPVAAAPVAAIALVSQVGRLPVYDPVTHGGTLPVEVTWKAWAWAAAAGVAAFGIVFVPVLASTRQKVAAELAGRSRPDRAPFYQRYFIDALALALGGLVWYELRSRGSIAGTSGEGEQNIDYTLLFAPAMFLVAVAIVFLRLFPLFSRLAAWVTARTGAAWLAVGFWRLGRNPYWYAWPVLLLVLASGLAIVAGSVASTLERSSREQVDYAVAADIHVAFAGAQGPISRDFVQAVRTTSGVVAVSQAMRRPAVHGTTSLGNTFTLLGVEPIEFSKVGWFRDDFSEQPVPSLLARIEAKVKPDPIYLPAGATEIGIWARADPPVRDLFLWVVLRDANSRSATVTFGPTAGEWQYQSAQVPGMVEPVEIVSIQTFEQAGPDGGHDTVLYLDDFQALIPGPSGAHVQVVVDFEDPGLWTGLPTSDGLDTTFGLAGEPPPPAAPLGSAYGRTTARVAMGRGTDGGIRGIYRTATAAPLPVIVNGLFLSATSTRLGEPFVISAGGAYVPVVAVETVDLFPTLDPNTEPFMVIDVNALIEFMELRGLTTARANELFVDTRPESHETVAEVLRASTGTAEFSDRESMLQSSLVDPLAVAGWRGIGVVAVIVTGVAACLGYATYLSAHARRTNSDAAYMRSLGLSRTAYLRLLLVEHSMVALLGLALGTASGLLVSRLAIDSISHTVTGRQLVPPYIMETSWIPIAFMLAAIGAVIALSLGAILRAFVNAPVHQLVRTRE